jgi:hypothetical protein
MIDNDGDSNDDDDDDGKGGKMKSSGLHGWHCG